MPSWSQEKAKLVQSLGGEVISIDEKSNARIRIDSCKLKSQRAKLGIYTAQKKLNKDTAKEQIEALKQEFGQSVTIENNGNNQVLVTIPDAGDNKSKLEMILDNFSQYKSQQLQLIKTLCNQMNENLQIQNPSKQQEEQELINEYTQSYNHQDFLKKVQELKAQQPNNEQQK